MERLMNNLKRNLKNPKTYIWGMVSITILYVYLMMIFEFNDWMIWIYAIFIIPLFFGLSEAYKYVLKDRSNIVLKDIDLVYVFFGVMFSYLLAHQLDLSAVIASSFIGILGYYLFKKHSVAIYCGSFAGMVSSFLFNYYEVGMIALLCGLLFVLLKPVFDGFGGKLGTTAFMSTILIALVFGKDMLIVTNELNIFRLILISILGVLIPFYIQHKFKQSAVFASAIASLVYALIIIYLIKDFLTCSVVFFSASFIGMSSKDKLPNIIYIFIAGIIHALLFHVYFEHYNGLGGKLGLMALTTVVITVGLRVMYNHLKNLFNQKRDEQNNYS